MAAAGAACNYAAVYAFGLTTTSSSSRAAAAAAAFSPHTPFLSSAVAVRKPLRVPRASNEKLTSGKFEKDWLRSDLNVIGFGLIGWVAPSSIPAINGKSLTGLFFHSIGTELAHWPTGPALTSDFWWWMLWWHLGLFLCLTFGQIGFKGRTEGYF